MKKVLVTGAAGYIGYHMAMRLLGLGKDVIGIDNRSRSTIPFRNFEFEMNEVDLCDASQTANIFRTHKFDAVFHFAALSDVSESMNFPCEYLQSNVGGTLNLLSTMEVCGVRKLIYSSSCSVYGHSDLPFREDDPCAPISIYGKTKHTCEDMILDLFDLGKLDPVILRYFNVLGNRYPQFGPYWHTRETRILSRIMQAASGRKPLTIYQSPSNTFDNSCIRDFVNVCDLVSAHLLAAKAEPMGDPIYNLGSGKPYSMIEIVRHCEDALNRKIPYELGEARPGDPSKAAADFSKIQSQLGWKPDYNQNSLATSIKQEWETEVRICQYLDHAISS